MEARTWQDMAKFGRVPCGLPIFTGGSNGHFAQVVDDILRTFLSAPCVETLPTIRTEPSELGKFRKGPQKLASKDLVETPALMGV